MQPPAGMRAVQRVFMIMLENESVAIAMEQPFLHEFAANGALLQNYHALTHPSQPNYIALTAGSAFGITDDNPPNINARHIGDLVEERGLDWKVYAERYPGNCFLGISLGTRPGQYVRKHVPFLDYVDVQNNRDRCNSHVVDATQFDADLATHSLPAFAFYVPDTLHDGHDTGVADADRWLQSRFGSLLKDPDFISGTLFIIVFDESHDNGGPNVVYCAFYGAGVKRGTVSDEYYDHYDLLRTIETVLHTGTLGHHDDEARPITDIW